MKNYLKNNHNHITKQPFKKKGHQKTSFWRQILATKTIAHSHLQASCYCQDIPREKHTKTDVQTDPKP